MGTMTDTTTLTTAAIPAIVATAHSRFRSGVTRPLPARRALLEALRTLLEDHEQELNAALYQDLRKSRQEAQLTEIGVLIGEINHTLRHLTAWNRRQRVNPGMALAPASAALIPEPKGAVLIISPWNYPVQLLLNPLIGVLAAGNTAVLKPSSQVPTVSALLGELIPQYFPSQEVQIVTGPTALTEALLEEKFNHIVFTGSGSVGKQVMAAAAQHLTPVTLELGGKSPVWVDDDAHLDQVARRLAWAKFTNAGQTCIAPDYVLTTPDRAPRLAQALTAAIADLYGSDPQRSENFGRIVGTRQFDRLTGLLAATPQEAVISGGQHDRDDLYIAPTVVLLDSEATPVQLGDAAEHALLSEEIFGPILPIVPVASAAAAVNLITSWDKPLALYLFSSSKATREFFIEHTSSGAVVCNAAIIHAGTAALPFGGVGESGMGAYHGEASVREFSHLKPILHKPHWPDTLRMIQPGSSERVQKLVQLLQRRG